MKQFRTLTALALCVLLLAGCGGAAAPVETQAPTPQPTTQATTEATTEATAEAPTEAPTVEVQAELMGEYDGTTYRNGYLGIGATFGEGWTYYPVEELQQVPEIAQQMLEDADLGDQYTDAALNNITTMLCENEEYLVTVNVVYQKLSLAERLSYAVISEKDLIDGVVSMADQLAQGYAAQGILVDSMEAVEVEFLGSSRYALKTYASIEDIPYYILQIYDYKLTGAYGAVITFGSFYEDNTEALLELFFRL